MATYKTEGIILRKQNFGEADQIIIFFSKHYGKIKAIAKGVRKMTSRKGGNLELLNHCSLFLVESRNFDLITEVEVINSFQFLKEKLELAAQSYYLAELIDKITVEKEENRKVFDLLIEILTEIPKFKIKELNFKLLIFAFEIRLLKVLGFWSAEEVQKRFSIEKKDFERLKKLEEIPLSEIKKFKTDRETIEKIGKMNRSFLNWVLERKLKSPEFIREVNQLKNSIK